MSARTVIEHALRVYYEDDRDPAGFVEQLLAKYDAERAAVPPLWIAEYEGAEPTLHLSVEAAREFCDDFAKAEAGGRCWDWRTEDGIDWQFWTHPDNDAPMYLTGGAVWQIKVEQPDPAGGES